ncbi:hypothetical protein VCUG_02250 [Vavraia culicis subsp. floridensis]|uniref:Uncharacterized protein n=1 Tax=Vavraia culicis (isolate floridensis) TaxID=948595 RepID=L2GRF6_VAVCU|nr:uncharacterized protein VCUG_02250 [Vavraia culicis subsp. floridensis]ELA46241.1 hypothetical protein VCUG_02250 [Vavraia culicis subsp. floridensis]
MVRNSTSHVNSNTEKSKEEDKQDTEELTHGNESHTLGTVAEDRIGSTSEVGHGVTNPNELSHEPQTNTERSHSKKIKFYAGCRKKDGNAECRILLRDKKDMSICADTFDVRCKETEKDKYRCKGFITFAEPRSSFESSSEEIFGLRTSCQTDRKHMKCFGESPYQPLGYDKTVNFEAICSKNNFGVVNCDTYDGTKRPDASTIELVELFCIDSENNIHCQGVSIVNGIDFGPKRELPHVPTLAPIEPAYEPVSGNAALIVGVCAFPFLFLLVFLFFCVSGDKKEKKRKLRSAWQNGGYNKS